MTLLDEDRLFPTEGRGRDLARALFDSVRHLPIISPHGHTDPRWLAGNKRFGNPADLFVTPDHYVFRMLYSHGLRLEDLGIQTRTGPRIATDPREVWRVFSAHYHVFRGTPSRLWIDHSLQEVFGVKKTLSAETADEIYEQIDDCLGRPEFRPRALFDRFNIEVIATTESPLDSLDHHAEVAASGWGGRMISTYRPDVVIDPEHPDFLNNLEVFSEISGEDALSWDGYLKAHRKRRLRFKAYGATATDHGHPTARTENLSQRAARELFDAVVRDPTDAIKAETFRAQMLTEMAKMSLDDGLVMQIHAGSRRNHSSAIFDRFGADKGFDIPGRTEYVTALGPLLDVVGHERDMTVILFTLDESSYGRELAPLAGVYPALKLGPAWWFFDSVDGMRRFRELTTETAGFYNTVGFNDDTRAFCSIPARHDVARRVDCAFLAALVTSGRLGETDAFEVAQDLTYNLAKKAYRL